MEFLLSKVEPRVAGAWELQGDIDRLRNSLPGVKYLMDKAEWSSFKSPYIADLLMQLRDVAYDAEDVIAVFDYYKLQKKIEGQITSQLPVSLVSFMRDAVSNSASKVKDVQTKLNFISGELKSVIGPLGPPDEPNSYHKALQHETSSFIAEPVFGREEEVEMIIKLMVKQPGGGTGSSNEASSSSLGRKKRRKNSNFSILPIVGIGGMGKTTLSQLIYNDVRVKNHFDLRIWVCVSDYFDIKKITREMIESATEGESRNDWKNFTNLDSLQQILKEKVALRRYLIVLDDVWHEKTRDWVSLCNPLNFGLEGSMIIITTRISKVAEVAGTLNPIELCGLPDDIYWELFKKCTFKSDDTSSYPELEDIGRRIAAKLKGSPLAAKTLGGILCANMTTKQWRNVLESQLWELEQNDDGILAALRVSYQYLPVHLKHCFLICSLYPKDYPLYAKRLSPIWMADGLIPSEKNILCPKGEEYFRELESRSFILRGHGGHVLHDLMHDLSKCLPLNSCYCQEEKNWSLENHNSVRHLSVYRKPIELIDREIGKCKNLRSLKFLNRGGYAPKLAPSTLASMFKQLIYLRLLDLEGCQIQELPENIGNLKLLFYIDLGKTRIKSLPESICQLYNLQFVNVRKCPIESFPKMFHNLINLRLISSSRFTPKEISAKIYGIGKLTSLERLPEFVVLKKDGHKIEELKNMTRLRGWMIISKLENVEGWRDAAQACLNNKEYLTELTLNWSPDRSTGKNGTAIDEDIIKGLQPHPNLECLIIKNYGGRTPASWLQVEKLPRLRHLSIEGCSNLKIVMNWYVQHQLLSLESLRITDCPLLSGPSNLNLPSTLSCLELDSCDEFDRSLPSNLNLPSTLSCLELDSCGEFDRSLPSCLENIHSLSRLTLQNCQHVTSLSSQVTNNLNYLNLSNCAELQCLELSNPSNLRILCIKKCPKLIQSKPSTTDNEAPVERIKQLLALLIDNTSLLKLPFLRNSPHSLGRLEIQGSLEERVFTGDVENWLSGPKNLGTLMFRDCSNLVSLPEDLHTLVTVKRIEITNCPKIQPLPENGLPPSLNKLIFYGCHPALMEQLEQHKKAIMEG